MCLPSSLYTSLTVVSQSAFPVAFNNKSPQSGRAYGDQWICVDLAARILDPIDLRVSHVVVGLILQAPSVKMSFQEVEGTSMSCILVASLGSAAWSSEAK